MFPPRKSPDLLELEERLCAEVREAMRSPSDPERLRKAVAALNDAVLRGRMPVQSERAKAAKADRAS